MRVIVHADDLGICRGITDRIIETHRHGCLKRTSIVANGEAFDHAVVRLRENPGLAWSLHLNLVEGRCLSPREEVTLLVNDRGFFKRGFVTLFLYHLFVPWQRHRLRQQVQRELDRQIERVRHALEAKRVLVDSHQHTHLLPFVFAIVMKRAAAWGVDAVRLADEPLHLPEPWPRGLAALLSLNLLKHGLLRCLSRRHRAELRRRGIRSPDYLLGVLSSGRMSAQAVRRGLKRIAARRPAADAEVEVLFHPGPAELSDLAVWRDNARQRSFYFSPRRAAETEALLSAELRSYVC